PVPSYQSQQRSHGDPYLKNQTERPHNDERQDRLEQKAKEELRARNKKLNNPQSVIDLENEPAYLRRKVELDDVPHSSEITVSRWTITGDEEPEIRKDNPYLHDNVD
ncbi:MAG: cell division protein FtsZ, partial [Saprospiraceae bacterium]|nr:cell division protein FtsZ [Saprospiraceae bacterium]